MHKQTPDKSKVWIEKILDSPPSDNQRWRLFLRGKPCFYRALFYCSEDKESLFKALDIVEREYAREPDLISDNIPYRCYMIALGSPSKTTVVTQSLPCLIRTAPLVAKSLISQMEPAFKMHSHHQSVRDALWKLITTVPEIDPLYSVKILKDHLRFAQKTPLDLLNNIDSCPASRVEISALAMELLANQK
tara:strand:- start:1386 stop:1955 length:570 start_codon:yes stop_codon:yes gene_type:complete